MTTRCKMVCTSMTKTKNSSMNKEEVPFLYSYDFSVVYGDTEENKKFFASTPTGNLKIGAVRDDLFEPGRSYYVDMTLAE